jgi:Ser/Thr protein kinase RdoA (MazF antagonist)
LRIEWTALPHAVTDQVADRIGDYRVTAAATGDHAEIASTVTGTGGSVFIKAARSELGVRSLRYEMLVSKAVKQPYSPAVEWHFEEAGWLVVAFEHLDGRHADLTPGSPDLDWLDQTLHHLAATAAPDSAMDGDTLVHTDLNPANLIVTAHGLKVVDWAFATKARPWVELAMLVQWLIGGGHTPAQAEQWVQRYPAWQATDRDILDDFASRNAAKWSLKAEHNAAGWVRDLATRNGQWWTYRQSQT